MSSQVLSQSPRQGLNPRQSETVERLLTAGLEELREAGYEALTVRTVAQRAGVSPATAYTYLASKNHLIAELFLRRLRQETDGPASSGTPSKTAGGTTVERVRAVTSDLVATLETEPELSTGATVALLGTDPEVARLRVSIGTEFVRRFESALGPVEDAAVIEALVLAFSGALLQVGMGLLSYPAMRSRMDAVVASILKGHVE